MSGFLLPDEEGRLQADVLKPATPAPEPSEAFLLPGEEPAADRAASTLRNVIPVNPDQAAETQRLAAATGTPADVVSRNPDPVKTEARLAEIRRAMASSPVLARQLLDPSFAALAHDDTENLSMVAGTLKPVEGPAPSVGSYISGLLSSFMLGAEGTRQGIRQQFADLMGFEQMSADAARKGAGVATRQAASTPKFESSTASGVYSGLSSVIQQLPGVAASIATGSPAPMLALMGVQQEAQAYTKYRARGADPLLAGLAAMGEGATEILTELMPMSFLVKKLGKVGAGEFMVGLLARELPTEQIATFVEDAIDTAVANPDKTWGDYAKERPDAAYQTLVATLTQTGVMAGAGAALHRLTTPRPEEANQNAQALEQLIQLAEASKVRERSPESFAAFVDDAAQDGPVQNIQVNAAVFAQAAGESLQSLTEIMPSVKAQIAEALATEGELVIPLGEFAAHIPGTGMEKTLIDHLRTSPDAMTRAEAKTFMQEAAEQFKTEATKILAEHEFSSAHQESAALVEQNLLAQLQAANRFTDDVNAPYARLTSAFYSVQAARLGITPEEMYQRYPLRITAEGISAGNVMTQDLGGPIVNIGLNVEGGDAISAQDAVNALVAAGVKVTESSVQKSDTEQTLVAKLDRPLTPEEAHAVSVAAKQEAIVQHAEGRGALYGPAAAKWGEFNPEYFLLPNGERASTVLHQSKVKNKTPAIRKFLKHLIPKERSKVTDTLAKNIIAQLKTLPAADEMVAVAYAGRAKRGWYAESARAISELFGFDAPHFAALLAALSPQTSIESNLVNTLRTWKNWTAAGRPSDRETIIKILAKSVEGRGDESSVLNAWINNAVHALQDIDTLTSQPLSGPKVNSFYLNLLGNVREVTNDAWMANYALVDQKIFEGRLNAAARDPGKSSGYLAMSSRVREVAEKISKLTGEEWTPTEVQETVWSWAKTIYEKANAANEPRSAYQLVLDDALTDELLRSTPDFATLFHEPKYASILKEAGYEDELRSLEPSRRDNERQPGEDDEPARQTGPFDRETQKRHEARAAKRLDKLAAGYVPSRTEYRRHLLSQGALERIPSYGKQVPGSVSVVGVHFSTGEQSYLSSAMYGRGARGAERDSVLAAKDRRLHQRVHFYVNQGSGVHPEAGVGHIAHAVRLNGLYDASSDPLKLFRNNKGTDKESAVLDAGFTGYYSRDFGNNAGAVVLLGTHSVPTAILGSAREANEVVREVPPPPSFSAERVLAEELLSSKLLPAGQMTGPQWAAALEKITPDLAARMPASAINKLRESDAPLYRDEVVRTFYQPANVQQEFANTAEKYGGETAWQKAKEEGRTKLDYNLWVTVRTPRFKKWFGNWEKYVGVKNGVWADDKVSKVIDPETGEPLVVFHGSQHAGFNAFNPDMTRDDVRPNSVWFSSNRWTAGTYAGSQRDAQVTQKKDENHQTMRGVYPVFLNIRNPHESNFEGANWDGMRVAKAWRVLDENDESIYSEDGYGYFTEEDAQALADKHPGAKLEYEDYGFETTNSVAKEAKKYGNDGAIIREVIDEGAPGVGTGEPSDVFVIFEANQAKSVWNIGTFGKQDNMLKQPSNRGQISFADDITKSPTVLTLLNGADLSTFVHELGHFELEVMTHIATQPNAPAEIAADVDTLLKWFGIGENKANGWSRLDVWNTMSLEDKRSRHEQLARGFEAYLFKGESPSVALQGIFSRLRAWMINVYRDLKNLNVNLSDEVRGVFDRLIATNEEILGAEAERSFTPLFNSAVEMGATEAEWKAYQEQGQAATQEAVDQLQTRSLRDMRWTTNMRSRMLSKLQNEANAKRAAIQTEVTTEVRQIPVYAVQRFLRYGELPTGEKVTGAKLDLPALKELYGEGPAAPWRYLSTGEHGLAGNEGLTPDTAAGMFGFTSGDHLVRAVLEAEPEATMIEAMTDQRMLERYGDLSSPAEISRAADAAIHNEVRGKFIATELNAIHKAAGRPKILAKAAKDFAAMVIARKKITELKPAQYAAAEARAGRAALAALKPKAATKTAPAQKTGDLVEAATQKRNQLVNHYAAKAAYEAKAEIEKKLAYLKDVGTRESIDIAYREQIEAMLERFDLRKVTNKDAAKRASLAAWITAQEEAGFEPTISDELRNEAFRKPYREMTVEEFRGLVDAVKNIEHLGRLKTKLLTAKDQREFAVAVGEITKTIDETAKNTLPEHRASDRGLLVKMKSLFREAVAIHRKFASMVRQWDGYKDGGTAWEYLVRNMNERGSFEALENEKATKALIPLFDKMAKAGKLSHKMFFPDSGKSFSREERIGIALNMGNEVNRERVLTGERLSPKQLDSILNTLTKDDWNFVQAVWDYLDTFRPQIAAKERRITGIEPEWVEAAVVHTPFGDYHGGYYPIAYDPLLSERSGADVNAEVQRQIQQGLYTRATTARGHTKARVESTGRPLRYDFGEVITRHVTQVIHDLAWHEYLIDANRLLRAQAVENAVRAHYGVETLKELKDTLRDIAIGNLGAEKGAKFWNHLRYGTTIGGLGVNVFNAIQNLTGLTQSASRIGTKWVLKGAAHWAGDATHFESAVRKMREKSEVMRDRGTGRTLQRDINDIRNRVTGEGSKIEAAFFYLQTKTQAVVDTPTWWGAYEKAMAASGMTEDKAVAIADQAVLDSQGGGLTKDQAGIQRGSAGLKLFTTFYSYFNLTANLTAEAYGRTDFKRPSEVALFAADMVLLYALPALFTTLLRAALQGDWDDEDKLAKKIIGDQISFAMGTVVGLREAAAGVQAALGVGDGFGYTGPAAVRFFSDLYNLGKQVQQGEADEAFWKALDNVGGVLFHYPAGQLNRTASGIAALADGRTENPGVLLMGAAAKQ